MNTRMMAVALVVVGLLGVQPTHAQVVLLSSPADFSGNETIATFDGLSVACGDQVLSASGVAVLMTNGEGPRLNCVDTSPRQFGPAGVNSIDSFPAPFEDLKLTFPGPINRLGFEMRTAGPDDIDVTVQCLSSGVIIDQFTFATPVNSAFTFYAIEAAMTFDEVIIDVQEIANGSWRLDNLRFELTAPPDADGDGIPDDQDACPNSDLSPTIVIGGVDTGVENDLLDDGCAIADLIAQLLAADSSTNEIVLFLVDLKGEGIISGRDLGTILHDLNGDSQPFCGDGTVDPNEECDDGNNIDGDGCSANCTHDLCSDGSVPPCS